MIIGFLGKGGSGKSTLAHRYIQYLLANSHEVLAIDADHNMDLSYNLGVDTQEVFIGQSLDRLFEYAGLGVSSEYRDIFKMTKLPRFEIFPHDSFTKCITTQISDQLALATSGPHTNTILYDQSCSHILITPLKIYLPLLHLQSGQCVVVDEKAGTDSVGTGITTGFDCAVVVAEATPHGIKAAKQIIDLLAFYETPFVTVLNKSRGAESIALCNKILGIQPDVVNDFNINYLDIQKELDTDQIMVMKVLNKSIDNVVRRGTKSRLERTIQKFQRNEQYQNSQNH
jgi:CO dehydrogenase maturation factor